MIDKYGNLLICEHSDFTGGRYSFHTWNAPIIQDPAKVIPIWKDLNLMGKSVQSLRALGFCWDDIGKPDKHNGLQLDMPFVLEFTDGTTFEFDFTDGGTIRMSINQIPADITGNNVNVDADRIFSDFHGKRLMGLKMQIGTETPDFTWAYELDLPKQDAYIDKIILVFTDNLCLVFSAYYDFMIVKQVDLYELIY